MAYLAAAALAGSITSLSFMPWKIMRWQEIAMTLVVGIAFAVFGVPYLIGEVAGVDMTTLRTACFFTYIGATGANGIIPVIVKRYLPGSASAEPSKGDDA